MLINSSLLWIIAAGVAAFSLTCILYFKRNNTDIPVKLRYVLSTLRFLALFLLICLFLDIFIVNKISDKQKSLVVLSADNSTSMRLSNDSSEVISFFKNDYQKLIDELSENFTVKSVSFSNEVTENKSITLSDNNTNISEVFNYIDETYNSADVAATILITDGIPTSGNDPSSIASIQHYPIYTVGVGDTTSKNDIAITNIRYNKTSYINSKCVFEVNMKAKGYNNQDVLLQVYDNDKLTVSKNLSIDNNLFYNTFNIDIEPQNEGKHFYRFVIKAPEDDYIPENNEKVCIVNIIESKKNVYFIANGAHPDIAAMNMALESNDMYEVSTFQFNDLDISTLSSDDILILHNLPDISAKSDELFNRINKEKIPFLLVVGSKTSINTFNKVSEQCKIADANGSFEEAYPVQNKDFKSFSTDDILSEIVNSYSPLTTHFCSYTLPSSADVLFYQKIGNVSTTWPLVAVNKDINSRSAYIFGEGLWQWRIKNYTTSENFDCFDKIINDIVYYLSLSETFEYFQVNINEEYIEYEPIIINAKLYDSNFELSNKTDVLLLIKDSQKNEYPFYLNRTSDGDYSLTINDLSPGYYTWSATCQTYRQEGAFNITQANPEKFDLQARHNELQRISSNSGGSFFTLGEISNLTEAIRSEVKDENVFHYQTNKSLRQYLPLCILIFLLLGAEWVLRRRNGIY